MKRFTCVILLLFFLSSCSIGEGNTIQPELNINSDVIFEVDGILYSAHIVRLDADKISLEFFNTDDINGLCADVSASSCCLYFDDVKYNYYASTFSPVLKVFFNAVKCIELNKPNKISKTNNGSQIYYNDGTVIKVDNENFVVAISVKNNKFTIKRR